MGLLSDKWLVRKDGTAQTKDDREIMPMRTLHARTTSLSMLCGDGICEWDMTVCFLA